MTDDVDPSSDRDDLPVFPSHGQRSTSGVEQPSHAVVRAVADALEKGVTDLPPLNDVIDTDALNTLVRTDHQRGDEWPTIRFSYADHVVTVTETGDVTLSRQDGADPTAADRRPDWPHVTPVSDDDRAISNLAAKVVLAVADRSGHDPAHVRQVIDDTLDRPALARLNSTRADGTARAGATVQFSTLGYDVLVEPDGTIAVGSVLQRLQLTGANVLLVGTVPDSVMDRASVQLLGGGDRDRRRLFALLDRRVDSASDRLATIDDTAGAARAIDYATTARSAAGSRSAAESRIETGAEPDSDDTGAPGFEDSSAVTTETVDESLEAFATTIEETLGTIQKHRLEPTELRFCFDSLRPLLEDRGVDETRSILEPICKRVTAASGIGHYIFPVEYDSAQVQALEPLFEATIEVRIDGGEPAQRWHLHRSNYTTEWFTLPTD